MTSKIYLNEGVSAKEYFLGIDLLFRQNANEQYAVQMQRYMKDISMFYGIKATDRKQLSKDYIIKNGIPPIAKLPQIVKLCWDAPYRELQYFGMELMNRYKRKFSLNNITEIEYMILHAAWWDTVDFISVHLAGEWGMRFPDKIESVTRSWNKDKNIWLVRASILWQLKYKDQLNSELLFSLIEPHTSSREFFIAKAIGWVLRERSKSNPDEVKDFMGRVKLQPLSIREASKYLN